MNNQTEASVTTNAESPTWSLITVAYNSAPALREFWTNTNFPDSVTWYVVDNASTDDSVDVANSLGATVIKLRKNVGFGAANNIAFKQSCSSHVAFVNPDLQVDVSSLGALAAAADNSNAIVAPQLVYPDGTPQPNGRGYPYLWSKVRNRLDNGATETQYRHYARPGSRIEVVFAIGAAITGRRDLFESLGPWDEHFFVYYEDSDLGLRARKHGIPTILEGDVRWVHGWARETDGFNWQAWRRELPSMLKFYSRYPQLILPLPFVRPLKSDSKL